MNNGAQFIVDFYTNGPGKSILEEMVRKTIEEIDSNGHNNSTQRIYKKQTGSIESSPS